MIYHDAEGRSLLAREHAELLASEMRRVRRLGPEDAGDPSWTRLAAQLLGRVERPLRRRRHHASAYNA
jgi:hypothetical protein